MKTAADTSGSTVLDKSLQHCRDATTTTSRLPPEIRAWFDGVIASLTTGARINFWGQDLLQTAKSAGDDNLLNVYIHHPGVIRELILSRDPAVLIDAYLEGDLVIEGKPGDAAAFGKELTSFSPNLIQTFRLWWEAQSLPGLPYFHRSNPVWDKLQPHSPERDRVTVQAHYDVGNEFYKLWLDPLMVYSCAHFEDENMSLDAAQECKLDLICRKLRLKPGDHLLDVGCGWGALVRWAATRYGARCTGITLSQKQYEYNQNWIRESGLGNQVQVELRDYRELPEGTSFDKIVSIGMIEHVGIRNYPAYFRNIYAALKPGGLFLNHGITTTTEFITNRLPEAFINRYIFPDGELPAIGQTIQPALDAGWEVVDLESWRPHYARTLKCWAANLEQRASEATKLVGEKRVNLWRLYLYGTASGFENNQMSIYQVLMRRVADSKWDLPLTRGGWLC